MIRVLAFCAVTAALTLALTMLLRDHGGLGAVAASADAEALIPACPQPHYYADGNMGPLFCVIDNPVALHFYAPLGKRTFALGPDATPGQVGEALIDDYNHHATEPELCAVYQLAAWRYHWRFGVSIVSGVGERLNFPSGWCREPSFHGV
jgi:hypothetical protein